jgi:hypothetical protein
MHFYWSGFGKSQRENGTLLWNLENMKHAPNRRVSRVLGGGATALLPHPRNTHFPANDAYLEKYITRLTRSQSYAIKDA